MDFAAIIVAAGSGSRAGAGVAKQWRIVAGKPAVRWSIEAFLAAGAKATTVVAPAAEMETARALLGDLDGLIFTAGGATRADSVKAGLAAIGPAPVVMVHDAARPFLTTDHVRALLDGLEGVQGAILAVPAARDGLWRAQTPQAFRTDALLRAYAAWDQDAAPTDDAGVIEAIGGQVRLVPGDPMLFKLTYPEDFVMAERLAGAARITRTGQGIDAHRLGPGDGVWLCGIKIAHHGCYPGGHRRGRHRRPLPAQRSAVARRPLAHLPGPRRPAGAPGGRDADQCGCDAGLREAAHQAAPRGHARPARRNPGPADRADQRQGHHHRGHGLHRARRRHPGPGHRQCGDAGLGRDDRPHLYSYASP